MKVKVKKLSKLFLILSVSMHSFAYSEETEKSAPFDITGFRLKSTNNFNNSSNVLGSGLTYSIDKNAYFQNSLDLNSYSNPATPCSANGVAIDPQLQMMQRFSTAANNMVLKQTSCPSVDRGFDFESCQEHKKCAEGLLGSDTVLRLSKDKSKFAEYVKPLIGSFTADMFARKQIENNLSNIEESKLLRKYAEQLSAGSSDKSKIRIQSTRSCEESYESRKNETIKYRECNHNLIDNAFSKVEKKLCDKQSPNCLNLKDEKYSDLANLTENKSKLNPDIVLDVVADSKIHDLMSYENDVNKELLAVLKDKSKKGNVDKKTAFIQKLKELDSANKLDPALHQIQKDLKDVTSLFNSLSRANGNPSKIVDLIHAAKVEKINNYFNQGCSKLTSFKRICENAHEVENGNRDFAPYLTGPEVAEMFRDDELDDKFFNDHVFELSDFAANKNEMRSMFKAYSCYVFKADTDYKKIFNGKCNVLNTYTNYSLSLESSLDLNRCKEEKVNNIVDDSFSGTPSSSSQTFSSGPSSFSSVASTSSTSEQMGPPSPRKEDTISMVAPSETIGTELAVQKTGVVDANSSSNSINGVTNSIASPITHTDSSLIPTTTNSASGSTNYNPIDSDLTPESATTQIDKKMNDLKSQLAKAEDKISKLNTEADGDLAIDPKVQSKADAEVEALKAQVKELKNQIAENNAAKAKIAQNPNDVQNIVRNNPTVSSYISQSNTRAPSSEPTQDNYRSPSTISDQTESRDSQRSAGLNASGTAAVNSAISASKSQKGGSGSTGGSASDELVLTKVDGLSTEAKQELINSKIKKGEVVIIEEGGIVTEYSPDYKNVDEKGNPTLKVDIKGTVASFKAKAKSKSKARVPASVVKSTADAKKDEEEKVKAEEARAQYLKLKAITNGVINSN